jgi:hypothetical protein
MPTYDGTYKLAVEDGRVLIRDVEGGSQSTHVPLEIYSNYAAQGTLTDSRQLRLRTQPYLESNTANAYVTDMGIESKTDNYFFITAPQKTANAGDRSTFVISKTSNVGIGTTDPEKPLHVVGDSWITGTLTASNIIGASPVTISSNLVMASGFTLTAGAIEPPSGAESNLNITGTITTSNITHASEVTLTSNLLIGSDKTLTTSNITHASEVTLTSNLLMGSDKTLTTSNIVARTDENLLISSNLEVGTSNLFVNTANGNVGIGVANPSYKLHVAGDIYSTSNVTGTTLKTGSLNGTGSVINCDSVFFPKRSAGNADGLAMYLDSGYYVVPAGTYYAWGGYPGIVLTSGSGEFRFHGWGSPSLLVRSDGGFTTFTGLHNSFVKFSDDDIGKILSSTGEYCTEFGNESYLNELNILDAFPIVKITTKSKDKSVFGVLSSNHSLEGKFQYAYINSIGEGGIWVCNKNGNFENGDYITSSDVRGYGMKQDVEYLANYTVAKITSDCDFTKIIQTKRKVKRNGHIYEYNGNEPVYEDVLDEHGNSIQEQKFKLRYLLEDGTETTEENAVYIAAFVGCTYHCG